MRTNPNSREALYTSFENMLSSKLVGYVHTVQLKLKIEQTTLPHNDELPPPHVMEDVITAIGRDRKNVDDAIECLDQRLQVRSPGTKQKALKLIKHMSQRGSVELQRALVRLSGRIKELQTFRCAPDAFKGDIPWKRVQEYAKEALEAIHAVKEGSETFGSRGSVTTISSSGGKRMEGFGSDSGGKGSSGGSGGRVDGGVGATTNSSSRRYEGFGNGGTTSRSSLKANVLEPDGDDIRNLSFGTKLAMGFSELKSAAMSGAIGLGDFTGGRGQADEKSASDGYRSTYSPPTRPQIDVDAFEGHGYVSPSTRNMMSSMTPMSSNSSSAYSPRSPSDKTPTSTSQESLATPEERLVHGFVSKTSQGVRVAPTVDECSRFLGSCGGHGSLPLAKAFEKTLNNGTWKEVLRALCVLDVAATGGGVSGTPAVSTMVEYFKDHPASLRRASESAQDRVKSKAASVLGRLGIECTAAPVVVVAQTPGNGVVDLLSMESEAEHEVRNTNSTANADDGLPSLMEAMDVNTTDDVDNRNELTPNSPVAGLISAKPSDQVQSKASDPFGDWLGAEETSPVGMPQPASTTTKPTNVDPFAAMDMVGGGINGGSGISSVIEGPAVAKQPILDEFFASPSLTSPTSPPQSVNDGSQGARSGVLGAWHAATSGFTSSKSREEAAFDFGDLKKL